MKKILVPCDFSGPSLEAFKLAVNIAATSGGEVIALHILYLPIIHDPIFAEDSSFDPELMAELEESAKKKFNKMKSQLSMGSVQTSFEVMFGEIISIIKGVIEARKIDLVIIGTSGSWSFEEITGYQEIYIGSNTEKIVRHSPVPVLSVQTAPEITSIKKILLPSTLDLDQAEFISRVKALQEFFNASLHVLLISTMRHFRKDHDAQEALEGFARHYKLKDYVLHLKSYDNVEDGIIQFTHDEKVDLIAMATHARKGLAHLFNRSITEDLISHIHCPVWTHHLHK